MKTIEIIVPMKMRRYLLLLSGDKQWYVTKRLPNEFERNVRIRCHVYVSNHRMGYEGLSGHICGTFDTNRIKCLKWKGDGWEKSRETDEWDVGFTKNEKKKLEGDDLWLWNIKNVEIFSDPKELSEYGRTAPPTMWTYLGES